MAVAPLARINILQLMKLVALSAVASAALGFFWPFYRAGVLSAVGLLAFGSICMPLSVVVASFLMVRPGPIRDWFIIALLAVSVGSTLAVNLALARFVAVILRGWYAGRSPMDLDSIQAIAMIVGGLSVLAPTFVLLVRRAVPRRCGRCGRRTAVGGGPCRSIMPGGSRTTCLACGATGAFAE